MQKMDFVSISSQFRTEVQNIMNSKEITKKEVGNASRLFSKFSLLEMNSHQGKAFLDDAVRFFVVLNHYLCNCPGERAKSRFVTRLALGIFFSVIDRIEMDLLLARKIRKIIDVIADTNSYHNILSIEILRIYSKILDKFPSKFMQVLVKRHLDEGHESCEKLCDIAESASDVETQAVIIEVFIKLFQSFDGERELGNTFLRIVRDWAPKLENNIYQNIRIVLDRFNENSSDIFCINCETIEIDSRRVVEFQGSSDTDDIWLDFNLPERKLSFFCSTKFSHSLDDSAMYPPSTGWEVLSLFVDDVLNATFHYEKEQEMLTIAIFLETSVLSLPRCSDFPKTTKLEILISNKADRFDKLIQEVLPNIFGKLFSLSSRDLQEFDSSTTIDLSSAKESEDGSSPILEHFEMRRRYSTVDDYPIVMVSDTDSDSDDVVLLSYEQSKESRQQVYKISGRSHGLELSHETSFRKGSVLTRSVLTKDKFNQSVSPISFSHLLLGPRSRKYSTDSAGEALNRQMTSTKQKVSTVVEKKTKISSSLSSMILNRQKKPEDIKKKNPSLDGSDFFMETMLDERHESLAENRLDLSKVEKWLNNLPGEETKQTFSRRSEEEPTNLLVSEIFSREIEEPPNLLVPRLSTPEYTPISQKSSNLPPEERIALMMRSTGDRTSEVAIGINKSSNNEAQEVNSNLGYRDANDLLRMLSSEEKETVDNPKDDQEINIDSYDNVDELENLPVEPNREDNNSIEDSEDNVPLCVLLVKTTNDCLSRDEKPNKNRKPDSELQAQVKTSSPTNEETVSRVIGVIDTITDTIKDINVNCDTSFENNRHSILNETTSTMGEFSNGLVKKRRKLYNPADLSYLSTYVTEDYVKSKDNLKSSPLQNPLDVVREVAKMKDCSHKKIKSIEFKPKIKKQKERKNVTPKHEKIKNVKNQKNVTPKHEKTKQSSYKLVKPKKVEKKVVKTVETVMITTTKEVSKPTVKDRKLSASYKWFNKLNETLKACKRKVKQRKKLVGKTVESTSSSSSMQPFDLALRSLKEERKRKELQRSQINAVRKLECQVFSDDVFSSEEFKTKTNLAEKSDVKVIKGHEKVSATENKSKPKKNYCKNTALIKKRPERSCDTSQESRGTSKRKLESASPAPVEKRIQELFSDPHQIGHTTTSSIKVLENVLLQPSVEELRRMYEGLKELVKSHNRFYADHVNFIQSNEALIPLMKNDVHARPIFNFFENLFKQGDINI